MIPWFLCPLLKLLIATSTITDSSNEQSVSISTNDANVDNHDSSNGIINGEGKNQEENKNNPSHSISFAFENKISNGISIENLSVHYVGNVSNGILSIDDHVLTSLKVIHDHVMIILKLPVINNTFFHFNNVKFANQLESELSLERLASIKRRFFLFDIQRLVFVWMIYMKQKFADNPQAFEQVIKDVESINSKVLKNESRVPCNFFKLEPVMDDWSKSHFHELLKIEFFENHSKIISTFIHIMKAFYDENDKQKMSCLELKTKYFNGNYIKRSILTYWIVIYDPQGAMRLCIKNEINHSKRLDFKKKISIKMCIKILINRKFQTFETLKVQYLSRSITKLFLEQKTRFSVRDHHQLSAFLDRFDEIDLLKREIVSRLVGFESASGGSLEWNQMKFQEMASEHITRYDPFRMRNIRSKKYVQLFNATGELYEKVMNRLKTFESSNNSEIVFFDNPDFPNQLYSLLTERRESDLIPSQDSFWHHLSRLLFKWIIKMKEFTDYSFKESFEDIQPIASKVNENIGNDLNIVFSLDLKSIMASKKGESVQIATFKELMACELAENSSILEKFAEILSRYYTLQNLDCEELKSRYFDDDFDNDQLLKFLIILHDPLGVLRSKCLANEIPTSITTLNNINSRGSTFVTKEGFDDYLAKIKIFQEPKDLEISNMNSVTERMIKSFLKHGKKFQILDQSNLLILLKELKKIINMKEISGEHLLSLFEFKSNSHVGNDHFNLKISLK